jgi:hypothetical protein
MKSGYFTKIGTLWSLVNVDSHAYTNLKPPKVLGLTLRISLLKGDIGSKTIQNNRCYFILKMLHILAMIIIKKSFRFLKSKV